MTSCSWARREATALPIGPAAPVIRIRISLPAGVDPEGMAKRPQDGKAAARFARHCPLAWPRAGQT